MAGGSRSVCHLIQSPMFTLFFALPCSKDFGDRCVPSQLGQSLGVRLPTLGTDSAVLKKLHSLSGVLMTLIAPYWPKWPWFPDLLDLVVDNPLALPTCPDLVRLPHFHQRHLRIHMLSLHAWRLSSALSGLKVSQSD